VIRSVQPNKVLHDLSSKQDTQGLHTLCMLNFKLTCTVFSHNGLLPAVHLPETCPPFPALCMFDDGIPCLDPTEEIFFSLHYYVAMLKHDSLDKAPLNYEALNRQ